MRNFAIVVLMTSILALSGCSCGPCISSSEKEFIAKLKTNLKSKYDSVNLSDVHPGSWNEVCAIAGGINANFGIEKRSDGSTSLIKIRNDSPGRITDKYDETALIFVYPDKSIEVFRATPDKMEFTAGEDVRPCVERAFAKLVVELDATQISQQSRDYSGKASDYIKLNLTKGN